jgi:hypothetical protein
MTHCPNCDCEFDAKLVDYLQPHVEDIKYGPELMEFVAEMQDKLLRNRHKGDWTNLNLDDVFFKMVDEVVEARRAVREGEGIPSQTSEAIDVANYAFIMWDIMKRGVKDSVGRRPGEPHYGTPF